MGSFYTNYTLRGPGQQEVAKALAGHAAFVSPQERECVVVFDEQSETQDQTAIASVAVNLSRMFGCPVLAVLNHDDDVLWYQLYLNGELVDEYNSMPDYFDFGSTAEPRGPAGGDAHVLCRAFPSGDAAKVENVLRKSSLDEGGYVFEVERHADLMSALDAPAFGVGSGYRSIAQFGELPEGLNPGDLMMVT